MESHAEIERKYEVGEHTVMPQLSELAGTALGGVVIGSAVVDDEVALEAEYFDTVTFELARHRIALRRRVGGADEGWHLKLPAEEGRTELQWPLGTSGSVETDAAHGAEAGRESLVPDVVVGPVRALVGGGELQVIARLSTRRTTIRLLDEGGAGVVELADDLVTAWEAATGTVRRWREWEAELLDGGPDSRHGRTALLDAVEQLLLTAGARPASSSSKLATALGRTGLGEPVVAPEH